MPILCKARALAQRRAMPADVQQFASRLDRAQAKLRTDIGLRSVSQQVDEWVRRAAAHSSKVDVRDAAEALKEKLTAVENELVQVEYQGARDRLHLPAKLNHQMAS